MKKFQNAKNKKKKFILNDDQKKLKTFKLTIINLMFLFYKE